MDKKDKDDFAEFIGAVLVMAFFVGLMFFSPMF